MGLDTIPTRGNTTMLAEWFNVLKSVLANDIVPRDVNGIPADEGGSLGTIDYPWLNVRAKNLFLNGSLVVPGKITARTHRIVSGKANADGYPNFLTPAGSGNGLSAVLSATATPFSAFINGTEVDVSSDMTYSSLTAAPGSNNTCTINDALLNDLPDSKYLGEHDSRVITIDAVGSEITALNGKVAAFKVNTEVFLAKVDTTNNCLKPILRGWGGTTRQTIDDDDVITLLKLNTFLLKDDGATKIASTYFPESVATVPSAATAGKVYIERSTGKHYYDDGATVSAAYMVIGYAVCTSADCVYVAHEDFDLFWLPDMASDYYTDDTTSVIVRAGSRVSVCGQMIEFLEYQHVTQASHMDTGESVAADTVFYLYVTPTGDIKFSSIAPRNMDQMKLGFYHPTKYYRCIGAVMTDGASAFRDDQVVDFTADGNWVCPVGVSEVLIEAFGGGGGGGQGGVLQGSDTTYYYSGGVGGGGCGKTVSVLPVTPGKVYAASPGAGGAGGSGGGSSGDYGDDGSASTFGGATVARGGMAGAGGTEIGNTIFDLAQARYNTPSNGVAGGGSGGCGVYDIGPIGHGTPSALYAGGAHGTKSTYWYAGGGGGGGHGGVGANGGDGNNGGTGVAGGSAGANTGAGGGGGGAGYSTGGAGGNGGSGKVTVRWAKPRFEHPASM